MTTFAAPPIDPAIASQLSESELEAELTLASLTTAREATFLVLLAERQQRRQARRGETAGDQPPVWRRLVDSFASREGISD